MKRAMPPAVTQHPGAHSTKKETAKEKKRERERERERQKGAFTALAKTSTDTSGERSCASHCDSAPRSTQQKERESESKRQGENRKRRRKRKRKEKVFPATTLRPRTRQGKSATSYDDVSRYALEMETIAARLHEKTLSSLLKTFSLVHGTYLLTTERLLTVL